MVYNIKLISEIAKQYSSLKESLKELKSLGKEGACLDHVNKHYNLADNAIQFLKKTAPYKLQEALDVGGLEKELIDIGNVHVDIQLDER